MRRFEIADMSMAPALLPGDYLIARRDESPGPGEIVVFEQRAGFWMVKRVAGPPHRIPERHVWVLSDNRLETLADSRTLGPIPTSGMYRAVWRYWPARRFGSLAPLASR